MAILSNAQIVCRVVFVIIKLRSGLEINQRLARGICGFPCRSQPPMHSAQYEVSARAAVPIACARPCHKRRHLDLRHRIVDGTSDAGGIIRTVVGVNERRIAITNLSTDLFCRILNSPPKFGDVPAVSQVEVRGPHLRG
jgi:hypothetical protein